MLHVRHEVQTGRVVVGIEGVLEERAAALLAETVALLPPKAIVVLDLARADVIRGPALVKLASLFKMRPCVLLRGLRPEHDYLLRHLPRRQPRWPERMTP